MSVPMDAPSRSWLRASDVDVTDLAVLAETETVAADYPFAHSVVKNVLIYDSHSLPLGDRRAEVEAELARALAEGPGVILLKSAFSDTSVIDAATQAFLAIIESERASGGDQGDHFGVPGANARIWNAQEKLARLAPDVFVEYFANDPIALGAHAWLGPGYQMTSQVNLVYPGGKAQEPHRDYHLGFCTDERAEEYPAHAHHMSGFLTLQGAVAHCDMPVESGTTMLLPHSQRYPLGYVAWRNPEVKKYFAEHMVQLPLEKGDVVYFSPALLHGAGTNHTSDVQRMANLLQVSSAFGRAMESLNRLDMCEITYPVLAEKAKQANWTTRDTQNVVAACAEGYSFPTNLDSDQPIGGLAPITQAEVMLAALQRGASADEAIADLRAQYRRTLP
ncbi:MAG: hypothetical protein RJB01_135 [Actinomycetota bacterium]